MYVTDVDSEILDTVVIKALQPLGKDGGQTPDKRQMLYPTLHNYSAWQSIDTRGQRVSK